MKSLEGSLGTEKKSISTSRNFHYPPRTFLRKKLRSQYHKRLLFSNARKFWNDLLIYVKGLTDALSRTMPILHTYLGKFRHHLVVRSFFKKLFLLFIVKCLIYRKLKILDQYNEQPYAHHIQLLTFFYLYFFYVYIYIFLLNGFKVNWKHYDISFLNSLACISKKYSSYIIIVI